MIKDTRVVSAGIDLIVENKHVQSSYLIFISYFSRKLGKQIDTNAQKKKKQFGRQHIQKYFDYLKF
jgi:hypothetical protein